MTASRPRRILTGLGAVALLATAGCSADADSTPTSTTSTTTAVHEHDPVAVTAVDFDFQDLPRSIPAGTRLTLRNAAPSELHELVAFRLDDDEQRSVQELLALPPAELGQLLGAAPPRTVLLAPPGGEQVAAVGDGTLDEPGRYLVMCSIPTGVDPAVYLAAAAESNGEQPQVAGGPPHFVQGMAAELIVE